MLTKKKIIIASLVLVIIAGPVSIIDDLGRNVTITKYPPERIVPLASSCTEILFALGLGDKVVGVDYSNYPQEVQESACM